MQPPIDAAERARRLGNVAAILIELARREQAAEAGRDDNCAADVDATKTKGSNG